MKFCKDCQHLAGSICQAPQCFYFDLVTGQKKHYYAENARRFETLCGGAARFFKKRSAPAPLPAEPF